VGVSYPSAYGVRFRQREWPRVGGLRLDRFSRYHHGSRHPEVQVRREIWFHKVLWSYIPCHWKGFAVMAAVIFPTVLAILAGQAALDAVGYASADWLPFPVFFIPALLFLLGVAKRHS
jgi:hypothetical protein